VDGDGVADDTDGDGIPDYLDNDESWIKNNKKFPIDINVLVML
jgi:hypothetical protein